MSSTTMKHVTSIPRHIWVYGIAIVWLVVTLYPVFWLVMSSFKTNYSLFNNPWSLPTHLMFSNYATAWKTADVGIYFLNSVYLTVGSMVLGLVLSLFAVYPISRLNTRISSWTYLVFVFGVVVPMNSLLVPLFVMFSNMGLTDSRFGLLLFYTATNIPFNIFVIYGFMKSVPRELDESALMDGASIAQMLFRVIIPVIKPAIATAAILSFLTKWNEFMFALTFLSSQMKRTLPCGLTYFRDMFSLDYVPMLAAIVISIAPIIVFYIAMEKNVVAGLTAGAVKG